MKRSFPVFTCAVAFALAVPALCQTDSGEIKSELRNPRKWAISVEGGANSLSSIAGPVATLYAHPQMAVDLGLGISKVGPRLGFRTRYLFSREKMAYFAGLGLKHGFGWDDRDVEVDDPDSDGNINLRIESGTYLDLMAGAEYLANNGFLLIVNVGYSKMLALFYELPADSGYSRDTIKSSVLGSGILFSVSLGKAF